MVWVYTKKRVGDRDFRGYQETKQAGLYQGKGENAIFWRRAIFGYKNAGNPQKGTSSGGRKGK